MKKSILMSALLIAGLATTSPRITAATLPSALEQSQQENVKIDAEKLPEAIGVNLSHIVLVIRHFVLIFSFSGMILF
jgi:hypothetical protein